MWTKYLKDVSLMEDLILKVLFEHIQDQETWKI
jgi:hypothetical protein